MTDPATALAGRRERSLLELPSVARMAAILAERCREPSWVRTLVASLDRFGSLGGHDDRVGERVHERAPRGAQLMGESERAGHVRSPAQGGARTADALHEAHGPALAAITPQDAAACFRHCGYGRPS